MEIKKLVIAAFLVIALFAASICMVMLARNQQEINSYIQSQKLSNRNKTDEKSESGFSSSHKALAQNGAVENDFNRDNADDDSNGENFGDENADIESIPDEGSGDEAEEDENPNEENMDEGQNASSKGSNKPLSSKISGKVPKQRVLYFSKNTGFTDKAPAVSSDSSSSASSDPSSTVTPPEEIFTAEMNDKSAKEISEQFKIKIIIARQSSDYINSDISKYISDEKLINNELASITQILSQFSADIFFEMKVEKLVLIGENTQATTAYISNTALLISCKNSSATSLTKSLYNLILEQLTENIFNETKAFFPQELQPKNFHYGDYLADCIYPKPTKELAYFCCVNAQKSEKQDVISAMEMLLLQPEKVIELHRSAKLFAKFKIAAQYISGKFPSLKTNKAILHVLG